MRLCSAGVKNELSSLTTSKRRYGVLSFALCGVSLAAIVHTSAYAQTATPYTINAGQSVDASQLPGDTSAVVNNGMITTNGSPTINNSISGTGGL